MADNYTEESSQVVKQDNINEISKTSSLDLEIQDMMTVDLYNSSMVSITYSDKTVKVGIALPRSLVKQTDKTCGDVKRSTFILRNEGTCVHHRI
ncbi:MAG: hypothetical protein WAK17_17760 [Candidatus Nitrosopolaris sp.]|jgi:hypothetical protein